MMRPSFAALLVCLWAITIRFSSAGPPRYLPGDDEHDEQAPLLSISPYPSRNYSVGFSLASSYGAAAVIIDDANEGKKTHSWVVYGDSEYQSVMAKLSLDASRHLAPPYGDMGQYFDDIPRVTARRLLKKAGLPASHDVGVLATVIKKLRSQIETELKITVVDATLTTTHLEALYQDDVEDICEYVGFKYIIPKDMFYPILWETSSAYAGYGFGLCEHWRNDTRCESEMSKFPRIAILAVHYSQTALTSTIAMLRVAIGAYEPFHQRIENFELGSDKKDLYSSEEEYWRHVRVALVQRMLETPAMRKPVTIILTGDMVSDTKFLTVLKETMTEHLKTLPPIYSDDAVVVAAKGAAEFRRRGQAPWQVNRPW